MKHVILTTYYRTIQEYILYYRNIITKNCLIIVELDISFNIYPLLRSKFNALCNISYNNNIKVVQYLYAKLLLGHFKSAFRNKTSCKENFEKYIL